MKVTNPKQFKTSFSDKGRECTACGEFKEWVDFTVHSRSTTGRTSKCKECKKNSRPARDTKREHYSAKKHLANLAKTDPEEIKARRIRGSLLNRARKNEELRATTPSKTEIKEWLLKQKPYACYYSKEAVKVFDIVIDHKTPTTLGGTNSLDNLCITNHKHNTSKGWMTEREYKDLLGLIIEWSDKGEGLLRRLRQGFFR